MIDCILFVSFGGPEGPDDVIPFLENVLRGRPVPRERLLDVANHYMHFGGVSPINAQNRDIISRLDQSLQQAGIELPIYWGNRNWTPTILDALKQIREEGHALALPIFTNMFSSYSGCRQYRENITHAQRELGDLAPAVAPRLRFGFNHPRFIAAQAELLEQTIRNVPPNERSKLRLFFTAHSIPLAMSDRCDYVRQLNESARLIVNDVVNRSPNPDLPWELVYQSRSGSPRQPWLEPDVCDRIQELACDQLSAALVVPLGFVSDHLEVRYDLDIQAKALCEQLGIGYYRAAAVSSHPEFIAMLVDLIAERMDGNENRLALGHLPPLYDVCPEDCCSRE